MIGFPDILIVLKALAYLEMAELLSAGIDFFYQFSTSIDQLAFYIYSTVKGINFLIYLSVAFLTRVLFGQCVRFMDYKRHTFFISHTGST